MAICLKPYYYNYFLWENHDHKILGIFGNQTGEENVCFLMLINLECLN